MTSDRVQAIEELFEQAAAAHAAYEATKLDGVYDQQWPQWYAEYAVEHGIADLIGREVSSDELADFLATRWDQLQNLDPKPTEPWAAYTARQIATEF